MSSLPFDSDETGSPRASRLWWLVPAAIVVVLTLVLLLLGNGNEKVGGGTSYDASDVGFRGIYLIFEELGYPVERSRKASGGDVRWILFPNKASAREASALSEWVREGGRALLAVDDGEFASQLGLAVSITNVGGEKNDRQKADQEALLKQREKAKPARTSDPDLGEVYFGSLEVGGPPGGRAWGRLEGKPLVTIYPKGKGELWLLHRPDLLTNANMREGDNSVLACRLAEAMLAGRPRARLTFDEYCHGLQERPDVFHLLLTPPIRAATLEALLLTGLVLWHFGVRFGVLRRVPPPPRRSKEEFLDAMAELLTRRRDRGEAFRTIRDDFIRRLEEELGLPAGTPVEQTMRESARRRGLPLETLMSLCSPLAESRMSPKAFLEAVHQLAQLDAKK